MPTSTELEQALRNEDAWQRLIEKRLGQLSQFLRWAASCEDGGSATSLRLKHREDVARCREVLPLFYEPWWGVVVYSCFDSVTGTRAAAPFFAKPIGTAAAEKTLARLPFPARSVQHHRTQATLTGAKRSLTSVCDKADAIQTIMLATDGTFEDRFNRLMALGIWWWGRTTCFDALIRAGALAINGRGFRPNTAHLLGSSGPAAGFAQIWGVEVTRSTADTCEGILKRWSERWSYVATIARVDWSGTGYDTGDFENALCIFQERPRLTSGRPDPAIFIERSRPGERITRGPASGGGIPSRSPNARRGKAPSERATPSTATG
jgi:hypothetical protein